MSSLSKYVILAIMICSPATAEVKKSDLLKAVKDFGQAYGVADFCLAWAGDIIPHPSLPDKIEMAMFDANIAADDIRYFQDAYIAPYMGAIEQGKMLSTMDGGATCKVMTAEGSAKIAVKADNDLLGLISEFSKQ